MIANAVPPVGRLLYLNDAAQTNLSNDNNNNRSYPSTKAEVQRHEDKVHMNENEMNRVSDQTPDEADSQTSGQACVAQYGRLAVDLPQHSSDGGGSARIQQSAIHSSENPGVTSGPAPITGVFSTNRRPSYTSKAPSALTHLPKTIEEIHSSPDSLPKLQELSKDFGSERRLASSDFQNGQRSSARDLLNLHGQASFDSLDEYSNPETPQSSHLNENDASIPNGAGPSTSLLHRRDRSARCRTEILSGQEWEAAARAEVLTVRCRDHIGELHKHKFGSGSKGKCIKVNDKWHTPIEFESMSGRASCKDWKRSIRFHGQHLQRLIEDQFITLHAISCTCGVCCGDDTLTGPVKLFQSVKRKRSQVVGGGAPGMVGMGVKRKSLSDEYRGFRERSGSCNADNDVFAVGQDDSAMPPMTPVTPMTPITPHTPFGAVCLTPLATSAAAVVSFRPSSPPKCVTLQVPVPQLPMAPRTVAHGNNTKIDVPTPFIMQAAVSTANAPGISNHVLGGADFSALSQQHWMQLEETASNLVSMANRLKLMVEQTKVQCEAISNSALTQAKIQAESEKQEALLSLRRGHLQPQSINHTVVSIEPASQTQQFAVQVPRVCANCARDAYLECTGCYRMYYCGPYCQQRDWAVHKLKCRDVADDVAGNATLTHVAMVTSDNK